MPDTSGVTSDDLHTVFIRLAAAVDRAWMTALAGSREIDAARAASAAAALTAWRVIAYLPPKITAATSNTKHGKAITASTATDIPRSS